MLSLEVSRIFSGHLNGWWNLVDVNILSVTPFFISARYTSQIALQSVSLIWGWNPIRN